MKSIISYLINNGIEYKQLGSTSIMYEGFYNWFGVTNYDINAEGIESIKRSINNNVQH